MNKKAQSALCIAFLLVLPFPVLAENQVDIGAGGSGDTYYFDATSISKSGPNRFTYSAKVKFSSPKSVEEAIQMRRAHGLKTAGYSKLKVSFALEEIDCKLKKSRNLSAKDLDQDGKILDQRKANGPWDDISPGTIYDRSLLG